MGKKAFMCSAPASWKSLQSDIKLQNLVPIQGYYKLWEMIPFLLSLAPFSFNSCLVTLLVLSLNEPSYKNLVFFLV